ncbi:hypothetical protein RBU00_05000 [Rhizobium sp. AN63]|uniref:hypothetical protein n=1 Tax=Rhizobium sp. AN63 TaxID=3035210 RepID=UPI0027D4049F|nr:hypothetical protein [Rhizobium sp. AN63]MDQ4405737.1 hypothetical protein [Rhizobium sp. AN63]
MKPPLWAAFSLRAQKQRRRPDDEGGNRYLPAIASFLEAGQAKGRMICTIIASSKKRPIAFVIY